MRSFFGPDNKGSDGRELGRKGKADNQLEQSAAWPTWVWLLLWLVIALALRFSLLFSKDAWMDEVATILFSLGNFSRLVPLNEIIDLEAVLRPLQITPGTSAFDVVRYLLTEDNHPPTYFIIAHWWMGIVHRFYPQSDGYASLWAARALAAIFGALAVPATYALAWISFRKQTTGLVCAALMAVSPLSVYVSQEARHYSLAILMVIASLCCFIDAAQSLQRHKQIERWKALLWILINLSGVTVHYFCGLTVIAEGMTLAVLLVRQCQQKSDAWRRSHWISLYSVAVGTSVGIFLWLPVLANFYGSHQTSFLRTDYQELSDWIDPIVSPFLHIVYAVMSPVTTGYSWQAVAAIVVTSLLMLGWAVWLMVVVVRSLRGQVRDASAQDTSGRDALIQSSKIDQKSHQRTSILAMAGFLLMANLLFMVICYGTGFNIARSHRYSFVYFPSIIVLAGAGLAPLWEMTRGPKAVSIAGLITNARARARKSKHTHWQSNFERWRVKGRTFVAAAICVSFISSLFVVNNISLKIYNADRFIELVQQETSYQPIIGTVAFTTQKPIVVGLDIMAIAWEIKRNFDPASPSGGWNNTPRFVLAERAEDSTVNVETRLIDALDGLSRPFDLWMMNFGEGLESARCDRLTDGIANKGNYSYSHYLCK